MNETTTESKPTLTEALRADAAQPRDDAAPQAPALSGVSDTLRGMGLNVPEGANEAEVLRELTAAAAQARDYYTQAQQYERQLANYYAQQQAQQQQQAQPAQKGWWEAPEFDPSWERALTVDESGNIVAKPGADPTLPLKYERWRAHQAQVFKDFASDPGKILDKWWQQKQDAVQQAVDQRLAAIQQQHEAINFVAQNKDWLYQTDAFGRSQMSPDGELFMRAASALGQLGLPPQAQTYLAQQALGNARLERLLGVLQEKHPAVLADIFGQTPAGAPQPNAIKQMMEAEAAQGGMSLKDQNSPAYTPVGAEGVPVLPAERLRRTIRAAGMSPRDFAREFVDWRPRRRY